MLDGDWSSDVCSSDLNFNTRIDIKEQGTYPLAYQTYTPDLCHQCGNAPCAQACTFDAIFSLASGIVMTDWNKCTGDGACVDACPYGARFLDKENGNKSDKCDFCLARLDLGLEPACVDACPSHARIFGDLAKPQGEFAEYLKQHLDRGDKQLLEQVFHTIANKS
jgi:Fe-S-cluster-containing dehydrogenase component